MSVSPTLTLEPVWHNGPSCPLGCPRSAAPRSASPTGVPGPTPPRTRSRPSRWPCGWARRAWRATSGSPGTARPCSTTTAWCAAASAGARSPTCDRAELPAHIPTLGELYETVGTDLDLSLDVKDPAAFDRTVEVARAAGRRRARAPLALLPRLAAGGASGASACPEVRLVDSTFLGQMPDGPEERAAALAAAGIDAVNLHHSEWTGGLTRSSTASRCCASGGTRSTTAILDDLLDAGIDAVYCDHVDRMVDALRRRRVARRAPVRGRRCRPGGQTRTKARPDDGVDRDRARR